MASRFLAGSCLIGFLVLTGCSSSESVNENTSLAPVDAIRGALPKRPPSRASEVQFCPAGRTIGTCRGFRCRNGSFTGVHRPGTSDRCQGQVGERV